MKKRVSNRAQFFILAAVIISAVIVSLSLTVNYARINKEPQNFYDTSYEIKKEAGGVIDYQIFSNLPDDTNLSDFVSKAAKEIIDQSPNANFVVIFGDNSSMSLINFGTDTASSNNKETKGRNFKIINTIRTGGSTTTTEIPYATFSGGEVHQIEINKGTIDVLINEATYKFPVTKQKQVIIIIQKEADNEKFVDVK